MATERWIAGSGVGFTWTTIINSSDIVAIPNQSSVLSSVSDIANQTALDVYADLSFTMPSTTTAAPNKLDFYIFPLNSDGATYGDAQFSAGSQSTKTPSPSLWCGTFVLPVGTQVIDGAITGIVIPPGSFRFLMQNNSGVTLSSGIVRYRTYDLQVT